MYKLLSAIFLCNLACSAEQPHDTDLTSSGTYLDSEASNPTTDTGGTTGSSSSTGDDTSNSTDTTGTESKCGNGVLDLDEECELGEPYCHACVRDRLVFVTGFDQRFMASDINGVVGADVICDVIARANGLDGPDGDRRYMAWLSDEQSSVIDRFRPAPGRYVRVDGLPVADSWSALLGGVLVGAPRLGADGTDEYDLPVWTGTTPDGLYDGKGSCSGWTNSNGNASWGVASATSSKWTQLGVSLCETSQALYCFEQPVEPVCSLTPCDTDADCPSGTVCFPLVDGAGTKLCSAPCKTDAGCHMGCDNQPQVFCSEKMLCEPVLCLATDNKCDCRPWLDGQMACF